MHGHTGMAGLAVDKTSVLFDKNAEDSRDRRCIVRMVSELNGNDAERNAKRVGEGFPNETMTANDSGFSVLSRTLPGLSCRLPRGRTAVGSQPGKDGDERALAARCGPRGEVALIVEIDGAPKISHAVWRGRDVHAAREA